MINELIVGASPLQRVSPSAPAARPVCAAPDCSHSPAWSGPSPAAAASPPPAASGCAPHAGCTPSLDATKQPRDAMRGGD